MDYWWKRRSIRKRSDEVVELVYASVEMSSAFKQAAVMLPGNTMHSVFTRRNIIGIIHSHSNYFFLLYSLFILAQHLVPVFKHILVSLPKHNSRLMYVHNRSFLWNRNHSCPSEICISSFKWRRHSFLSAQKQNGQS